MQFNWDENKRRENIRKHGIDFRRCEAVFSGWTITIEDHRFPYHENRFLTFGLLDSHVVAVAHTETRDLIHIISARKANIHEQALYFQNSPFPRITN